MADTKEKTLIIIKHDGVARGLMGEVMSRFERVGLKLVALEFIAASEDMGAAHYPDTNEWMEKVGKRTLSEYKEKAIDPVVKLGTDNPVEIGRMVKKWLIEYLSMGPVLAMVWEGPEAAAIGRKLVGETNPVKAAAGTIRGDFSWDNADLANDQKRPFYNIVHASGNPQEAKEEIELWFSGQELMKYNVNVHKAMGYFGKR